MTEGKSYIHKHYPTQYSCTIVSITNKGAKVKLKTTNGKKVKEKIEYYYSIDFHPEKGLWTPINNI